MGERWWEVGRVDFLRGGGVKSCHLQHWTLILSAVPVTLKIFKER